ncbi:hypothetical protein M404DRAFT_149035 [Pisolithus tinctorius Marx 270]|uniref:Uncharacterized protein n=1 Tax=Pisolithus tinctorius Marx 270 TaxID=870435 RepID=A0A0C3P319_PISTI|nr:hypothetical protein M404DRAFT_149035 [Pisolithus tinctorius Marx 270]
MVLDDFLRDNLECGTSSMNYYSKLYQITCSVFPHLIPVRFSILVPSVGISEGSIRIDTMSFDGLRRNGNTSSYLNGMDSMGQPGQQRKWTGIILCSMPPAWNKC